MFMNPICMAIQLCYDILMCSFNLSKMTCLWMLVSKPKMSLSAIVYNLEVKKKPHNNLLSHCIFHHQCIVSLMHGTYEMYNRETQIFSRDCYKSELFVFGPEISNLKNMYKVLKVMVHKIFYVSGPYYVISLMGNN